MSFFIDEMIIEFHLILNQTILNNENILKTMNDEVFKHSIEIFKRAKKNLNH